MDLRWTKGIQIFPNAVDTLPTAKPDFMVSRPPSLHKPFARSNRIRRIGLISPYSGGNLGNAAIITATIANIRKRIPAAEIVGITLNPSGTRRRHGIEAFPLAAVSRPYYSLVDSDIAKPNPQPPSMAVNAKQWLKKVPGLGSLLKAVRVWCCELTHILSAARVVRNLDRVIVPGGGALDEFWGGPWGHPWTLLKWTLLSRSCRTPFLFVSVGKCSLERPLSRFFVRIALRLAAYRSYRDKDSKSAVQSLMDARNDPVYPDLAFSYPCSVVPEPPSDERASGLVVGVNPIAYCDPRAWPVQDEGRYRVYVRHLSAMVQWVLRQGHHVLFFTTDGPDVATLEDVKMMISDPGIDSNTIQTLHVATTESPNNLLKGIAQVDLTIASRLHGVILSHLNGTPVLALSFDPKVDAHMKAVGQDKYCLGIDSLSHDALIERFTALRDARLQIRAHLHSQIREFRQLLDQQYDRILGTTTCDAQADFNDDQAGTGALENQGRSSQTAVELGDRDGRF